jgi:hypothetical protein
MYIETKWITLFTLVLFRFSVPENQQFWFLLYSEELRKEARQLKRELLAAKQKKAENVAKAEKRTEGKSF